MLKEKIRIFSLLFIIITCSLSTHLLGSKSYLEELEDAFVAKIEASHKRSGSATHEREAFTTTTEDDEENSIGKNVALDIKESFKEAKGFFALGEWSSWEKTKARFEKAEKALQNFKAKYTSQLTTLVQPKNIQQAKVVEDEDEEEEETTTSVTTTSTSTPSIPSSLPGMSAKPSAPAMQSTSAPSMPGPMTKPTAPAFPIMQAPAAPKAQTSQTPTMPGINTSTPTMPGVSQKPASAIAKTPSNTTPTMPGINTQPAVGPGGMPLA